MNKNNERNSPKNIIVDKINTIEKFFTASLFSIIVATVEILLFVVAVQTKYHGVSFFSKTWTILSLVIGILMLIIAIVTFVARGKKVKELEEYIDKLEV